MADTTLLKGLFSETVVGSPPEGWMLGHVTLSAHEGRVPIEAWRRGAFAIHEVAGSDPGARLTHAPTGMRIWTFANVDDAAMAADAIEPLHDWASLTAKDAAKDYQLGQRVKAAIEHIPGGPVGTRNIPGEGV